ncbi:hypothetical protein L0F63_007520 [Massospora cicadina]|nr:hypothetical protein L0F63_007520 [Massospora cicadina]
MEDAGFRSRVEARALKIRKAKILLKIFIMILAYNLVMLPLLILLIYELAAKHTLSMVADNVVVFAMASLTFVNPLMLLILHHDTWRELKATISRLRGFFLKPEPNKMGFQLQCDASEVALTSVKPQLTSATNLH